MISQRLKFIKPSPTLEVTKKANQLKEQGKKIISLSVGEPDFDTPDNVKLKAIEAINHGYTKYTNVDGIKPLKLAIQTKFKHENNVHFDLEEIIVSTGAKQVIYNLFMASLNDFDEVLIPAPYWVSYPDIVALAGGVPKIVDTEFDNNFKLLPENLDAAITAKTKWLILCSPSNPTGSAYSKEELEQLANVIRSHKHLYVMCDDIYEHILFDNAKFYTLAEVAPDLKDRIVIINGVSKAYSMTGWRIGYGAGPKDLIKAMNIIQSQSTSNASSISQYAALEALSGPQDYVKVNAQNFQQKRDFVLNILRGCKDIKCNIPDGAFYLFPSCQNLIGKTTPGGYVIKNDNDFASYLLEYAEVAIVPGIAFGAEGYFRISYATSYSDLEVACNRIVDSCNKLV